LSAKLFSPIKDSFFLSIRKWVAGRTKKKRCDKVLDVVVSIEFATDVKKDLLLWMSMGMLDYLERQ
jgi:hypothetical protein